MNKKNNYIWLFGENLGKTANNNSFYFWKHIINKKKDNINKYIILEKNSLNKKVYETLNKREKEIIESRYGLNGRNEETQKDIAKRLNISRSYVSRLEKRATTKILREFIKNKRDISK